MRVLPLSKRQKRELWAILPFPKGMRAATGLAPPRKQQAWMDALFQFFPAHYGIHRVAATLHFSEYRLHERDRSCGVLTPAECHIHPLQLISEKPRSILMTTNLQLNASILNLRNRHREIGL
jgi:hypothetical protein